jgi:hypothetical protein
MMFSKSTLYDPKTISYETDEGDPIAAGAFFQQAIDW